MGDIQWPSGKRLLTILMPLLRSLMNVSFEQIQEIQKKFLYEKVAEKFSKIFLDQKLLTKILKIFFSVKNDQKHFRKFFTLKSDKKHFC